MARMSPRHEQLTRAVLIAGLALAGCGKAAPSGSPLSCNGHPELCSRRYDQVAYPGTHDSYSNTSEKLASTNTTGKFDAPDQTWPIDRQLQDGIRVLHFEVHVYNGAVLVCHGLCEAGREPLLDELKRVADFVKSHPTEVVTLLLERSDANITADQIGDAFKAAGLEPYMHQQQPGQPWPTLEEMILHGDRVVALLDDTDGSSSPWLLPRWKLTWETPWDNQTASDFSRCDADRGTKGNSLYVVDTYLEDLIIQSAQHALLVNYDPFLIDRVLSCQQQESALPNFVMVNFYEVSDVFHVVDVLNGFAQGPASLDGFPPAGFEDGGGLDGLPDGGIAPHDGGA